MKALYEKANEGERTPERMSHLRQLARETGGEALGQEQWSEIVRDARWENLPDAAFLADLWYRRRCIGYYWRRGDLRIDGVPVNGPCSLALAKESIEEKALVCSSVTLQEAFRLFIVEDRLPRGEVFETTIPGVANGVPVETTHQYKGRRVPLSFVLAYLVAQALKHKLLREDLDVYNLDFGVWLDGLTALGHPMLCKLAFLVRDPRYSTANSKQWADALRFFPVSLAFSHESIDSVTEEMKALGKDLLKLESVTYGGKTFNFRFSVLTVGVWHCLSH